MRWKMNIFSCKHVLQMFLFYIFFFFCTISSFCDLLLQFSSSGTGRLCFVRLLSAPSLPFSYIHGAQAARRSLTLLAQRGFSPSMFFSLAGSHLPFINARWGWSEPENIETSCLQKPTINAAEGMEEKAVK